MKIGLAFDLRESFVHRPGDPPDAASEWDSEETVSLIEEAVRSNGHDVLRLGGGIDIVRLAARAPLDVDLVFNICEGRDGRSREAQVPAILELLQIPYTGSDPLTMAASLDKGVAKRLLRERGVPTPDYVVVSDPGQIGSLHLRYPLFAKPVHEGTGKGIAPDSMLRGERELKEKVGSILRRYHQPALVEEYLPGREFTVGIVGNSPPEAIGTMEVFVNDPGEAGIYSASSKAEWEKKVSYRFNGEVEADLRSQVESVALAAFTALECRDFGRIDVRCDAEGRPHVMEVNPLAGLSPLHSDLCFIARESGISYNELIGRIIQEAFRRNGAGVAA